MSCEITKVETRERKSAWDTAAAPAAQAAPAAAPRQPYGNWQKNYDNYDTAQQ